MVYDLTEAASVDDLENYWITEAYNYCDKSIKVLLLGNKCDAERNVNPEVDLGFILEDQEDGREEWVYH